MDTSKYRYLTDEELLRQLAVQRGLSPVIDALCERIEALIHTPRIECEYCGAILAGEGR